jgi:hypothetical protein
VEKLPEFTLAGRSPVQPGSRGAPRRRVQRLFGKFLLESELVSNNPGSLNPNCRQQAKALMDGSRAYHRHFGRYQESKPGYSKAPTPRTSLPVPSSCLLPRFLLHGSSPTSHPDHTERSVPSEKARLASLSLCPKEKQRPPRRQRKRTADCRLQTATAPRTLSILE